MIIEIGRNLASLIFVLIGAYVFYRLIKLIATGE